MRYINYFIGILLLLLVLRFAIFYQTKSNYINGQAVEIQTTLMSEPKTAANQQRFSVVLDDGTRIFVTAPAYPSYHYGDILKISGKINLKNSYLTIFFPQISNLGRSLAPIQSGLALTSVIRQKITGLFQKTLPPTYSSLLLGITFGIKEQMPKDFFENLQKSGVLHVIAASGMNVTMVGGVLSSIFVLFFRRQVALVCSIFGILFYAALAGFEPSIVRAAIMGGLVFVAQILGRQYVASYGLLLTAVLMLFIDPRLLFDIGFQLSFLATLGLIYIRPITSEVTEGLLGRWTRYIAEDLQTTISAQIATLPILLANFGTYSLVSVVVNGLVLWTVPILMIIGGAGAVVGLIFEFLGRLILYFAIPFLFYFEYIVNLFSAVGGGIAIDQFPWQFSVGYYCLLLAIIFYGQKSRSD